MKTLIITPAYSHAHHALASAVQRSRLPWLVLHEHSDLVRVRSMLLSHGLAKGFERLILVDADVVPGAGVLEALAASDEVTPERALFGLYPQRGAERWQVAVDDDADADEAIRAKRPFPIRHGGLGLCAIHSQSIERVVGTLPVITEDTGARWSPLCLPFVRGNDYFPEDRALCVRLTEAGTQLWCDPRLLAGHAMSQVITELRG